jgi:cyclophilin family peptidyl-prolyl cis-trans isomerase
MADIPQEETGLFEQLDSLQNNFDRERKIREAEAAADDLPRVELETSKGKIVIELFENEAPDTVGNFISLVEGGFYDGILFHRVKKGFMAQAGGFSMRGPQIVNYTIYDELDSDNLRRHFRGTISMAKVPGEPDSASTQFFITFTPQPGLDGLHTAFGRVISDMKIVDSLQVTVAPDSEGVDQLIEDIIPDQIISARVLRKRDHEYKPNRVTQ